MVLHPDAIAGFLRQQDALVRRRGLSGQPSHPGTAPHDAQLAARLKRLRKRAGAVRRSGGDPLTQLAGDAVFARIAAAARANA